jgi:hypothetical protein
MPTSLLPLLCSNLPIAPPCRKLFLLSPVFAPPLPLIAIAQLPLPLQESVSAGVGAVGGQKKRSWSPTTVLFLFAAVICEVRGRRSEEGSMCAPRLWSFVTSVMCKWQVI